MMTKLVLEVKHSKPIPDLTDLVAGRAYTLASVDDVCVALPIDFAAHVARLFVKPSDTIGRQLHAAVGVSGEAGELLDAVKKTWIYGKPLDLENVLEECGDLLFYIQAMLTECGYTMEDAMNHNYVKLAKRYPEGYTDAAAIQRSDKQ